MLRIRWERRIAGGSGVRRSDLVGMAVVALVLLAGCAQASSTIHVPSPTATVTPLPPAPLTWQTVAVPPGFNSIPSLHGPLAFTPSDGATAYLCGVTGTGSADRSPGVWATHDRGATWTHMADLPVARTIGWCWVVADSLDPTIVAAMVSWVPIGVGPVPNLSEDFASFDGGATWRLLGGNPQPFLVNQLATRQGVTLAILNSGVGGGDVRLWASHDQMRTWQPVSGPQGPEGWVNPAAIWVNPGSGAILLQANLDTPHLWDSDDGGQHWTQLPAPALDPASVLVAPPVAGELWQICGVTPHPADPSNGGKLACSTDGGQTWTQRALLTVTLSGPKGTYVQTVDLVAVADDGAVLAGGTPLERLAPGASAWQSLGPVPNAPLAYAEVPGAGVLWVWNTNATGMLAGPYPARGSQGG